MRKFDNKAALIEAKAQAQHQANLTSGGIFGSDGKRISDFEIERRDALTKTLFVGAAYAKLYGLPESISAWYIEGFGYSPV